MFEFCTSDNIHSAFCLFRCLKKPKTQTQPNWKWNKTNKPKTKKKPTGSKSRKGFSLTGNINSAHPWSLCIARCCHMCVIKHLWLIVVWCDWHMRFYLAVYTIWPDYCFTDPFKDQSRNVMLWQVGCCWYFAVLQGIPECWSWETRALLGLWFVVLDSSPNPFLKYSSTIIGFLPYQSFPGFKHLFQCKWGKYSGVLCWHVNV